MREELQNLLGRVDLDSEPSHTLQAMRTSFRLTLLSSLMAARHPAAISRQLCNSKRMTLDAMPSPLFPQEQQPCQGESLRPLSYFDRKTLVAVCDCGRC